jgi:transcriptional regulator with XRE-family HTH domain
MHPMKLETYIKLHDMTQEAFATKSGLSQASISRLLGKKKTTQRPSWHALAKIYRATNGEVTANDFFEVQAAE